MGVVMGSLGFLAGLELCGCEDQGFLVALLEEKSVGGWGDRGGRDICEGCSISIGLFRFQLDDGVGWPGGIPGVWVGEFVGDGCTVGSGGKFSVVNKCGGV